MGFEWDPEKDRLNAAKHNVSFDEAVFVFRGFSCRGRLAPGIWRAAPGCAWHRQQWRNSQRGLHNPGRQHPNYFGMEGEQT